jgi:hypothetical protein
MARIRSTKPEFWTDPKIVGLSFSARLLFLGMWNFADDCGHIEDEALRLKLQILPADDVNAQALVNELIDADLVEQLTGCLLIRGFTKHQKIDKRSACRFDESHLLPIDHPEPRYIAPDPPESSTSPADGREGSGGESKSPTDSPPNRRAPNPDETIVAESVDHALDLLKRDKTDSLTDAYEGAFHKAWERAVLEERNPRNVGKLILARYMAEMVSQPANGEYGKLQILVNEGGQRAFYAFNEAIIKAPDDWLRYARGVLKGHPAGDSR